MGMEPPQGLEATEGTPTAEGTFMVKVGSKEQSPFQIIDAAQGTALFEEESKRLAEAEMYVQDAIEYVAANEPRLEVPLGFAVEEAMLDSIGKSNSVVVPQPLVSAEATSGMIGTNEVTFSPL